MTTLHQLTGTYLALLEDMAVCEESDLESFQNTLVGLKGEIGGKLVSISKLLANMEADAKAINEAENKMYKRRRALESRAKWLRGYMAKNMDAQGIKRINDPELPVTLKDTGRPKLVIYNESVIPDGFMTWEWKLVPDNEAIREALEAGLDIPGAYLENGKYIVLG